MKKLRVDSSLCQGCHACELTCAKTYFKEEDPEKSAIRIWEKEDGGFEITVCDQCGICREMCAAMALSYDKKGVVRLNRKKCVGCLICVGECLRNYMYYHDDLPTPFKCVACGLCVKGCPSHALSVIGEN